MMKNNINNDRNAGGGCNDDYEFDEFGGISCFSIRVLPANRQIKF